MKHMFRSNPPVFSVIHAFCLLLLFATATYAGLPSPEASLHPIDGALTQRDGVIQIASPFINHGPSTVKVTFDIGDDVGRLPDTIELGAIVLSDAMTPFALKWERDGSPWGFGWRLNLYSSFEPTAKPVQHTLSRTAPQPRGTYHTYISYEPRSGLIAYAVVGVGDGDTIASGTVRMTESVSPYRFTARVGASLDMASTPITVPSMQWAPTFVPLGEVWTVGHKTDSGLFLSTHHFDLDETVTLKLDENFVGTVPGIFRVSYEARGRRSVLATDLATIESGTLELPAVHMGMGRGTLHLDYVLDERILATDSIGLSIGEIEVSVNQGTATVQDNMWRTEARVHSALPLHSVPLEITAEMNRWSWNDATRRYSQGVITEHIVFSGTIDTDAKGTAIPLVLPLPEESGNWSFDFKGASPDINIWVSVGGERLVGTPVVETEDIRLCTYNVKSFRGWPETPAFRDLGKLVPSDQMAFFADVLRELDCQVLGVQEGRSAAWMTRLAELLGNEIALSRTPTSVPGAIFAAFPILETRDFTHGLVGSNVPFSATAGAALIDINDMLVWVVNIHAQPFDAVLRAEEARVLAAELDQLLEENEHIVVLGDFNSESGSIHDVLHRRGFLNSMELTGGGKAYTMTDGQGVGRLAIDYIYVSPSLIGKVKQSHVVSDSGFRLTRASGENAWVYSDHLPVTAVLELETAR